MFSIVVNVIYEMKMRLSVQILAVWRCFREDVKLGLGGKIISCGKMSNSVISVLGQHEQKDTDEKNTIVFYLIF